MVTFNILIVICLAQNFTNNNMYINLSFCAIQLCERMTTVNMPCCVQHFISLVSINQYYFPMKRPLVKNKNLQTTVKPKINIYATGCFQGWKYSGMEVWKYSGMEVFRDGSIQGWKSPNGIEGMYRRLMNGLYSCLHR